MIRCVQPLFIYLNPGSYTSCVSVRVAEQRGCEQPITKRSERVDMNLSALDVERCESRGDSGDRDNDGQH